MIKHLTITTPGQGLHEFTDQLNALVRDAGVREGLCTLFVQHTSASLLIDAGHPWPAPLTGALKRVRFCSRQNCQENADPSAKRDLEHWLNRLVQENDPLYTHQNEGPDDMPGHIKSALTATQISIPVSEGQLALGTWQGVYLWEHRHRGGARRIVVHICA
ncbi:secondary thiamine-phosphate synthase enzyme YjbQ [Sulfuricaulis sp.]|uniref:secondary thiamine-phosphate synthase enzyme YjbQ n=1 Tax=Sulfuricaulis sp. TaxID=2003553 RepID=UPI00355A014B